MCLFGASEVSLRDAMRGGATDEEIKARGWPVFSLYTVFKFRMWRKYGRIVESPPLTFAVLV